MAIVCQGCGEPLPEKEQTCSHCGQRPEGGARAGRALPSRVWLLALGLVVVAPLLLQYHWRQQAATWMAAGDPIQLLAARPPPEADIQHWKEADARSGRASRPVERVRRRRARRPGSNGDRTRVARASAAGSRSDRTPEE